MEVRTYKGRAIEEVMARIREELGEDAYILSTSQGDNKSVEVKVGLEENREASNRPFCSSAPAAETEQRKGVITLDHVVSANLPQMLAAQGVCNDLTNLILANMGQPAPASSAAPAADQLIGTSLSKVFAFDSRFYSSSRAVAFIGATGVGKTTTIAKLAARLQSVFDIKVGLISLDYYRIGAGAQLQSFAEMMRVPCRVLQSGTDDVQSLRRMLAEFRHLDLVLIDTAGCGVREGERLTALERAIGPLQQVEKILVLPAPSNDIDLQMMLKAFAPVNYSRVLLTKLDESGYIGPVLNTVLKAGKPISFLTTGQRVPEDIEPASARRLGWMLTRTIH